MANKLVFLGMGGTIAGTSDVAGDNVGYTAAQVSVQQLLGAVPTLSHASTDFILESEQVCQIDSKDLSLADWFALTMCARNHLLRPEVSGIVITHGTDTIEETAYWLMRLLPSELQASKPVVLTCAMRPASALTPDGPANMADAATVATTCGARGVMLVCAGKIHSAEHVQKVHPYRVDAFDSGEAGPLGLIEEGCVRLLAAWPQVNNENSPVDIASLQACALPRVEILLSHAGAGGAMVRGLLRHEVGEAPVRGIVVAGTGNGTIHKELESALIQAQAQGIRVVRTSRCAYGQIVESSTGTKASGFQVYGLSAVKARIALMLDLASSP